MPVLEKKTLRFPRTPQSPEQQPQQQSDHRVPDHQAPGRIRNRYLPSDDPNSEYNSKSSETPEGRLSGRNDSDWYVPIGDETHLRSDDGRLRLEDPISSSGQRFGDPTSDPDSDHSTGNQSRYRSDDFHVKATNSHDHKERWSITLTPEMATEIDSILRSKKLPLRGSRQQFCAVALYEFIQLCHRLEEIPDSHVAVLESMNELNRNYQVVVNYDSMMRQQCRTIHDLVERNLKNQARVMVHELLQTIHRIKSKELKDKHLKRVRAEFGNLIGEAKPVSGRPSPVRTGNRK